MQYSENHSPESDDKTLRGSFVELTNYLRDFFVPQVQTVFALRGDVIDLEQAISGNNVIIRIPESKLNQWSGSVRLILRQLFAALSKRPEKYCPEGRYLPPFLLLWDEMARFGKFEDLTNAFSTLRSKGVTICAVIQSFAQLDHVYGPSVRRILVDCCPYIVIGAVQDPETQKFCSEIVGSAPILELSFGENYHPERNGFTFSRNLNRCREPVIHPEDFSMLNDFIVVSPYGKFRVKKGHYSNVLIHQSIAMAIRDYN